jgi:P-type E1-E2 ATPase
LLTVGLKQLGHVVAVTGDGTGDAPALLKSDVGIAMGITGTEVAKEASGIILLNDDISSIVPGIKWGRNILCAIRKFVQFTTVVNFVFLGIVLIGCIFLGKSPLSPSHMLWVCLIVGPFGCLALATEPASDNLLKEKPETARGPVITK